MQTVDEALLKLQKSKFRSSFKLDDKDRAYIEKKGIDVIKSHARDFISQRLAPAYPENDGRQTPMKGHPVFKAMHGTGCCCRGCLQKWYKVSPGRALTESEQERLVKLIMTWIERQL